MKKDGLLKGAFVLSIGTLFAKILGAVYRVPLTSLIGAEGLGIYQMVFPFYCILLTISSTGIPSALSKLIAEGKNAEEVLSRSLKLFGTIGFFGSLLMFSLAKCLAAAQGNSDAYLSYMTLSPSVFFVSLLSCYRGYYQGGKNMFPTAFSQIIEQFIKLVFVLLVLGVFPLSTRTKAAVACLGVTVSEVVAFFYVYIKFLRKNRRQKSDLRLSGSYVHLKTIFLTVLPIALSSALLPLSRAFDSFLVVNLLQLDKDVATAQYGIYSGGIESLVGVPVALCYGFAVSGIPILSSNKNDDKTLSKLLIYTFVFSAAIAVAVYFLSDFVVNLLYFRLGAEEKTLMSELLRVSAIEIVLLSLLQSLTSSLISLDALSIAPLNLGMGVIVKIVLVLSLVKIPEIGIYGVAISDISCYFVAAIADLLYIICRKKRKARAEKMAV